MISKLSNEEIEAIMANFRVNGSLLRFCPLGQGHIHDTYLVELNDNNEIKKYTFQRINTLVFREPELMMANWEKVTRHVGEKIAQLEGDKASRRSLRPVLSQSGQSYYRNPQGEYWRVYHYVDGCHTIETATTPEQAFEAGRAFGHFQKLIVDLSPDEMYETIPFFHHTPRRFERFLQVIEKASPERKAKAAEAISFALQRQSLVSLVTEGLSSGRLPVRVTHNDTKINNVLFDDETGRGLCVIDLDTTMPGSPLYDFGDLVRTGTCSAAEDETDLDLVAMDINLFAAVAEGYLSETADLLVEAEKQLLVMAGPLITFTIGLRFLTDYLEGDIYFKTRYPEHNLDRAKSQFKLLRSMEEQHQQMQKVIDCLFKILG